MKLWDHKSKYFSQLNDANQIRTIYKIEDSLALKIMKHKFIKSLEELADQLKISYFINQEQSFIEVYQQNQEEQYHNRYQDEIEIESSQIFIDSLKSLIEQVKKDIVQQDFDCNYDEFMNIKKSILKDKQTSQLISQTAQLNMANLDASYNVFQVNTCLPKVLKKYELKNSLTIKICQVDKPDKLNINYFDFLLINMAQEGIFIDSFGLNLYQSNPNFKQAVRQLKPLLQHHDSLLIEQVEFDDKSISENTYYNDTFRINGVNDIQMANITFFIQTSKDEHSCIYNLRRIFETIQENNNNNQSNRGFFKFGLSLHSTVGEDYLQNIHRFLTTQTQNLNYFKSPSEILIMVSDGNEKKIIEIFDEITCSNSSQYSGIYCQQNPASVKKFSNEAISVINKSIQLGSSSAFIIISQSEQQQLLKSSQKMGACQNEEYLIETFTIDLQEMQLTKNLQGLASPIIYDNDQYSCFDTNTLSQQSFSPEIVNLIQQYIKIGIHVFYIEYDLITNKLISNICELNLKTHEITFKAGSIFEQQRANNQGFKYFAKLREDNKEQNSQIELEDQEINENLNNEEMFKSKLIVRGMQQSIEIVKQVKLNIEKNKYILFEIPNEKEIPKEIQRIFTLIELQHKVWIHLGINSITIQGYKKTVGRIVPQIYNYLNSIQPKEQKEVQISLKQNLQLPSTWVPQESNLKLVTLDINSNEAAQSIQLFKKTLQKQIISVERIQNKALMKNYLFEKQKLQEKGDATERLLFHGTRTIQPKIIYDSEEEGFDFRLSNDGMYGRGTYFHETALYSDGYKFLTPQGNGQMFLATVLIGKPFTSGPQRYTAPPFINNQNGIRYDSVMSNQAQGNNMYIVYHNSKSYPLYLITYK